jgi:hypothetical protein
MATRRLRESVSRYVIRLFEKRGATVDNDANTITDTQKVTSKTIDREKAKVMVKRGQLIIS